MDGPAFGFLLAVISVLLNAVFSQVFTPSPEKQSARMLAFFKDNYEFTKEVTVTFTAEEMNDVISYASMYVEYYDYQDSLDKEKYEAFPENINNEDGSYKIIIYIMKKVPYQSTD